MIIGNVMTEEVRMVEVPVDLHLEENLQGEAEVRIRYFLHNITNHIGDIMVSELSISIPPIRKSSPTTTTIRSSVISIISIITRLFTGVTQVLK
jgi:hypothetical protein